MLPATELALPSSAIAHLRSQHPVGRYQQVFYVPDEDPDSVFVITAYEPQGKAKKAFRRRQRRKPK